ncbi:MAG: hypothetical protein HY924_15515 [Elusimicrobia bacterium]|nr:hypothetical protein [Elusimicrobiota bacterium]
MESHQRWLADFKKEVDEVLETLRASKAGPAGAETAAGAGSLPGQFEGLKSARVEYARLEFLVEDLQTKLASRTLQFESEAKVRDRLKERVHELSEQVANLEEKASAFRREAMAHSEEAKELDETLRVTMAARSQLVGALEDEKRQMETWMAESKSLKSKLDGMDSVLGQKESALHDAQARYEAACRTFAAETAELHKETGRLSSELEKSRLREAEAVSRLESSRSALEAERSRVHADAAVVTERAEAGQRAAAEAVARATETRNRMEAEAAEIRKHLDVEREHLRRELEKHHANMEEAYAKLESERAELEAERHQRHVEAAKASEEAQVLRRQGVDALEEARKLKAQLEAETDRLRAELRSEKERLAELSAGAGAEMKKALGLEKELSRKHEEELSLARRELELEREELLAEFEAERARIKRQHADSLETLRSSVRAEVAEEFRLRRIHSEQGLRREAILKGEDPAARAPEPQASPAHVSPPAPAPSTVRPPPAPSASKPGASRRLAGIAALAAVAVGLGLLAGSLGQDRVTLHEVPFSHPTALVWKGAELWVSDWYESAVYRMKLTDGKLSVLDRFSLPGSHVTGLAVGDGVVYAADSWKKEISLLKVEEGKLKVQKSWPSPGPSPSALYLEGSLLYSADGWAQRVYKHATDDDLTVLQSWKVGFAPAAVLPGQDYFWTAESETRRVYSHRHGSDLAVDSAWGLPELEKGREPLSCVGRSGERFWFGRDGSKVLLEASKKGLKRRAPKGD